MTAVLATHPRPVRELAPVVPERLDRVLRACLAKTPTSRGRMRPTCGANWSGYRYLSRRPFATLARSFGRLLVITSVLLLASLVLWWQRRGSAEQDDLVAFTLTDRSMRLTRATV